MRSLSAGSLICALSLVAGAAAAQTPDTATARDSIRVVRLAPVEVTVTRETEPIERVAQGVSLLNARDIQTARPTLGLDESLALVPGVVASNRYNFSLGTRIAIRGFGSRAGFGVRGVRVLMDGIPLTNADGQAKLNILDLGSAGEIEVVRGPSSTLYGNAAGGVISVHTETPPSRTLGGEARITLGDYGSGTRLGNLTKWQLKAGGQAGPAQYLASFARTSADGFREHSQARLSLFNGNTLLRLDSRSSLRVLLNVVDQPQGQNPGALPLDSALLRPRSSWPTYAATGAAERDRQVQGGLAYRRRLGHAHLDAMVYGANRIVDNPLVSAVIDLNRHAGGVRSTLTAPLRLAGLPADLVTGVDVELQRDARREFAVAGGGNRGAETRDQIDRVTAVGPFAQLALDATPHLRLTGGIRYDAVDFATADRFLSDGDNSGSRALRAVSPKLSALYSMGNAANLYATVATSFQTPTTTELINAPPAPGEACCVGGFNQALNPERALSWEAGLKGRLAGWLRYDLAAYTMDVKDEIVPFTVASAPDRNFYRNAGRSRHRGIEVGLEAAPTSFLLLSAAYTYSHFVFVDDGLPDVNDEGNLLPGIPPQQLVGRATVRAAGLDAELEARHVSRFFVNDANTASNPAYTVVDLRLEARRDFADLGVAPFAALENVFDRRYNDSVVVNAFGGRYFEPAPGRHLLLGLTVPIGGWQP